MFIQLIRLLRGVLRERPSISMNSSCRRYCITAPSGKRTECCRRAQL